MKFNRIISFIIACAMLLSMGAAASADTVSDPTVETINVRTGASGVATVSQKEGADGVWEVVSSLTSSSYTHAGTARVHIGNGTSAERIELSLDEDGNYSTDRILRYSLDAKASVDMTAFNFYTYYYYDNASKNNNHLGSAKVDTTSDQKPNANQEFKIDIIIDLNDLSSYYYVDSSLIGSTTGITVPTGATAVRFREPMFYMGSSAVTTADVKLYELSNVTKYTYPEGTSLSTVQNAVTDVYKVESVVPETLASWRWTVPENSAKPGTYNLTVAHATTFHGSIAIPVDADLSDGKAGFVRASAVLKPNVNLYYTSNKMNAVYLEDGTQIGTYVLTDCNSLAVSYPSLGTNKIKYDMFIDKSTKTCYYYINGRLIGTNVYAPSSDATESTSVTLDKFGIYIGATGPAVSQNTVAAEIREVTRYYYPSTTTLQQVQAEIAGATGINTEIIAPANRNGNTSTMSHAAEGTVFTSKTSTATPASDAMNTRITFGEAVDFTASADKFVVMSADMKVNAHTAKTSFQPAMFETSAKGGSRYTAGELVLKAGETYKMKAVIDVVNKTVYFYANEFLVGNSTLTLDNISDFVFFFNPRDYEQDGFAVGEEEIVLSNVCANHYNAAYTGTLADVVAKEVGADVQTCFLRSAKIAEYTESETHPDNTYRLEVHASEYDETKHRLFVAGYDVAEDGTETMVFANECGSKDLYMSVPVGGYDKIKVFVWDAEYTPIHFTFEPVFSRR